MKVNNAVLQLIKTFEGCLLNAYLDSVQVTTIGYGATFYEDGTKVKLGDRITQERANELLEWHIQEFAEGVSNLIKVDLNDNQFSALVSFAFNLGVGNLSKSTLLKKVNDNPNNHMIRTEFLKWNKAGGKTLNGLTARRNAEAKLYFS